MAVPVIFPDGTKRLVIAELRASHHVSPHVAAAPIAVTAFVQCPINADPQWRYVWRNGRWIARPRFGSLARLVVSDAVPWWSGIACMVDEAMPADPRTESMGPHRAAA